MLDKRFINATEVAEMLGIHRETVYRWYKKGKLPEPQKLGAVLRWDVESLLTFVNQKGGDVSNAPAA